MSEYVEYAKALGEFAANLLNNGLIITNLDKCRKDPTPTDDNCSCIIEEINQFSEKIATLNAQCVEMCKKYDIVRNYTDTRYQLNGIEGNKINDTIATRARILKTRLNAKLGELLEEDKSNNYIKQYLKLEEERDSESEKLDERTTKLLNQYLNIGSLLDELSLNESQQKEILSTYVHNFYTNIDFESVSNILGEGKKYINAQFLDSQQEISDSQGSQQEMKKKCIEFIKKEIERSNKKEDSSIQDPHVAMQTIKLSEIPENAEFFHFTRAKNIPNILKEGLRWDLESRENEVGNDYEHPSIYFSNGENGLLGTLDVWIRWEYNRISRKGNRPRGDVITDPEVLKETYELIFDDFTERKYLQLDLVEGTDKTKSDFNSEGEDFKKQQEIDVGGPDHLTKWMMGEYTDWTSAKMEDWNMMTHVKGRSIDKDRIKMITDEQGRSDALYVIEEVYEMQKGKKQYTYLDSFIKYIKERREQMQAQKSQSIGKDVVSIYDDVQRTDEIEKFIIKEAENIDIINQTNEHKGGDER